MKKIILIFVLLLIFIPLVFAENLLVGVDIEDLTGNAIVLNGEDYVIYFSLLQIN